jgi:hypothetical protein
MAYTTTPELKSFSATSRSHVVSQLPIRERPPDVVALYRHVRRVPDGDSVESLGGVPPSAGRSPKADSPNVYLSTGPVVADADAADARAVGRLNQPSHARPDDGHAVRVHVEPLGRAVGRVLVGDAYRVSRREVVEGGFEFGSGRDDGHTAIARVAIVPVALVALTARSGAVFVAPQRGGTCRRAEECEERTAGEFVHASSHSGDVPMFFDRSRTCRPAEFVRVV